ncbi:MAG: ACP S-malonyltransferase, partial [Chitinispirillaceae bacterium]
KILLLFPGQGSQEVGMGRDLFQNDEYFRSLVAYGSELVEENLEKICLRGPDKKLMQARFLQPLLSAVSLGYMRQLEAQGIHADMVLGHSLGEITALAAAGIVDDKQAVAMAAKRGQLMDEVGSEITGAMMAVLFLPYERVQTLLDDMNADERLVLANDNAPEQVVVSGDVELLQLFAEKVAEQGGKTRKLCVAGPWHSPFMKKARYAFEEWAAPIKFKKPSTPIILNATAKTEHHPTTIKHLVTWQLTSPVFFRECLQTAQEYEFDTLVEIGPGRVLSGLARVNGLKNAKMFNVNNLRGIEKISEIGK